jgi:glycosyltransferase involved in cell wall biosynthesis
MWSQVCLAGYFLKHKPDVFFAPGQLIPLVIPKNTVVTVHDSAFIPFASAYTFFGRMYLRFMNRLIIHKAKQIITPSQFSKDELVKYYDIPPKIIQVVPEGYNNTYRFKQDAKEDIERILTKYSITKPFIMSVGRLEEKKNTKRIVEAFDILKKERDIQLVLVGKPGVGYEEVKNSIEQSPYKADIKELGYVGEEDIAMLLRHAEVFLFPSLYEGFGIPVLEAMASGCPTVASKGVSLEEVGGNAPLYIDPKNTQDIVRSVQLFFKDKNLRDEKITQGLQQAQFFSWEKTAQAAWKVLQSFLK